MEIFLSIIIFIAGLAIVICLHEAGHLSMAKLFKVYCEEFSIGFGPKLISINPKDKATGKKKWETSLNIRLLPLGGYVAMVGEDDDSELREAGEEPIPKERTFSGVAHWKQAIIMVAGITMNVILSYFLFLFGNAFGVQQDPYSNRIAFDSGSRFAQVEGLQSGDVIESFDLKLGDLVDDEGNLLPVEERTLKIVDGTGKEIPETAYQALADEGFFAPGYFSSLYGYDFNPNDPLREIGADAYLGEYDYYSLSDALSISIYDWADDTRQSISVVKYDETSGSVVPLTEEDGADLGLRFAPADPTTETIVDEATGEETVQATSTSSMTASFDFIPDGKEEGETRHGEVEIPSVPEAYVDDDGNTSYRASFGSIGLTVHMNYMPDADAGRRGSETITGESFGQAIVQSFVDQGESIASVYIALGSLFTPAGWENVGGIVSMFMVNSQAVDLGFYYVMYVWGLISINLAVMNLLPIPGLDGWQLLLCIIESIRKKPLSNKFKSYASYIGLGALLILAAVLVVLDCIRYFA